MKNQDIEISVVITTRNRRYEVARALQSVLKQTVPPLEIILVDDNSTDGTEDYLKKHFQGRYKYIYNRTVRGAGRSRNIGIAAARGEYIAFLDSDNEWYSNKLERMREICEKDSSIDVVCSKYRKHIEFSSYIYPGDTVEEQLNIAEEILLHNLADASASLYKKSFLEEIDGFSEDMYTNIDWELLLRAFKMLSPNVKKIQDVLSENWEMYDGLSAQSECEISERIQMLNEYWNGISNSHMNSLFYKQFIIDHIEYNSEYEKRFQFYKWMNYDPQWIECEYSYYEENMKAINYKLLDCERMLYRKSSGYELLYNWISVKQQNYSFAKILAQMKIDKVAVYGIGKHGKLLLDELLAAGVEVNFIVDKEPKEMYYKDIKVYTLKKELPFTDAIIVTPYLEIDSVKKELELKTNARIISLEDLILGLQQLEKETNIHG